MMGIDDVLDEINNLVQKNKIESLGQARGLIFDHWSQFPPDKMSSMREEAARIQSMIFDLLEAQGTFSAEDIDWDDAIVI